MDLNAGYHASPAAKTAKSTTMFSACVRVVSMSCVHVCECVQTY